ncbi:MAG: PKD domain-containing protein [Mariniphaga sp.]
MSIKILALIILSFSHFETKGADPFAIKLNNTNPVQFCVDPVLVADHLTIEGAANIQGIKISISGFIQGEDELLYTGILSSNWSSAKGELELTGTSNAQDYVDALRSIRYRNNKNVPTLGLRKMTISLNDVDYLPDTQHFYRFIPKSGSRWTEARAESETTTYYGLQGYLATITSKVENDFIVLKTQMPGYIGASDAAIDGEWRWVTGPEGLENLGKGRLFWRGTGSQAQSNPALYGPVNGEYSNWDRLEPNNALQGGVNRENYGHITVFPKDPANSYKWNDVEDKGGTGDWYPQGYIIEFGGMPGDPIVNLIATIDLQVNTVSLSTVAVSAICEGSGITLNRQDTTASFLWTPTTSLSSATISNPVASPKTTTNYTVTGTRGTCTASKTYTVSVNPAPISLLKPEENICAGNSITLDPGSHQSYLWGNNASTRNILVSTAGFYKVKITSAQGCSRTDSTKVVVHQYPTVDLSALQTLVCGSSKAATVSITTNAPSYLLESTDSRAVVNNLNVSVLDFGSYPMKYTAQHTYCPVSKEFALEFHPIPVFSLGNDSTICNPENIVLKAGNQFQSYLWSTGGATPNITVKTPGNYSVNIVDNNGCKATDAVNIAFTDRPKIDLSKLETLICGKYATTLAVSSDKNVEWTLVSSNPKAVIDKLSVSVNPADFGNYPMKLGATDQFSCATDTVFNIGFYKIPKVGLTIDEQKCYGYNLDATYVGDAQIDLALFTWVFGGDTIVKGVGLVKQKIPLGINQSKRDLVLTVGQDGCSASHTIGDIRVIPTLGLSVKDSILCQPDFFEFLATNTETGVKYDWDFGDSTTGTGTSPKHNYSLYGLYDIGLTVTTNKNCSNSVLIKNMVHVAPVPTIGFDMSPGICLAPGEHGISYAGSGNTRDQYFWDLTGLAPSEIVKDPLNTQGPFIFDLKTKPATTIGLKVVSEFGCQSHPAVFNLKRQPDVSVGFTSIAGCTPFETTLTGTVSDNIDQVAFDWDFGDSTKGKGPSVSHTYGQPDKTFSIVLTATSSLTGCADTLEKKDAARTYPKPEAAFAMDNNVVYNDKPDVTFTDNSKGASSYFWDFGDGTTSPVQSPSHHFVKTGHMKVYLEVSNSDQCTDTVSHRLLVAFDRLFTPDAFSPNAPNIKDREYLLNSEGIPPQGYHLTVISRWNDVVFETKDEIKGWDGRMPNGNFAPPGSYLWVLNYIDFLGRSHRQTGKVVLLF